MIAMLWKWIVSVFTADKIGVLVRKMLLSTASAVMKEVLDLDNQKKAYELVKELNSREDLTGKQKAKIFNQKMLSFLKEVGKSVSESALNCLREMAVVSAKAE